MNLPRIAAAFVILFTLPCGAHAQSENDASLVQRRDRIKPGPNAPHTLSTREKLDCSISLKKYLGQDTFGRLLIEELEDGFFRLNWLSDEKRVERNLQLLELLRKDPPVSQPTSRLTQISKAQAEQIFLKVQQNPVTGLLSLPRYDLDPNNLLGFCFGRSMDVHLEALRFGVHKESILKIWAEGTFRKPGTNWGYHVATMIRGDHGSWFVYDELLGGVMTPDEWYAKLRDDYRGGRSMMLYVTEAKRFGSRSSRPYTRADLTDPFYNRYFDDLLQHFKAETKVILPD